MRNEEKKKQEEKRVEWREELGYYALERKPSAKLRLHRSERSGSRIGTVPVDLGKDDRRKGSCTFLLCSVRAMEG